MCCHTSGIHEIFFMHLPFLLLKEVTWQLLVHPSCSQFSWFEIHAFFDHFSCLACAVLLQETMKFFPCVDVSPLLLFFFNALQNGTLDITCAFEHACDVAGLKFAPDRSFLLLRLCCHASERHAIFFRHLYLWFYLLICFCFLLSKQPRWLSLVHTKVCAVQPVSVLSFASAKLIAVWILIFLKNDRLQLLFIAPQNVITQASVRGQITQMKPPWSSFQFWGTLKNYVS